MGKIDIKRLPKINIFIKFGIIPKKIYTEKIFLNFFAKTLDKGA